MKLTLRPPRTQRARRSRNPSGTPPYRQSPCGFDSGCGRGPFGRAAGGPQDRDTPTTRIGSTSPDRGPFRRSSSVSPSQSKSRSLRECQCGRRRQPPPPRAPSSPRPSPATGGEKTSDWFAPASPQPGKGGQGGRPPTAQVCPASAGAGAPTARAPPAGPGMGPAVSRRDRVRRPPVAWDMGTAGRRLRSGGAGLPAATGGTPWPRARRRQPGSFDVTEALAAGAAGQRHGPAGGEELQRDLPYFSESRERRPERAYIRRTARTDTAARAAQSGPNGSRRATARSGRPAASTPLPTSTPRATSVAPATSTARTAGVVAEAARRAPLPYDRPGHRRRDRRCCRSRAADRAAASGPGGRGPGGLSGGPGAPGAPGRRRHPWHQRHLQAPRAPAPSARTAPAPPSTPGPRTRRR